MRIKKGFTLAEVLIVLMVIGAIATMTIPSLMRGVTETQWKTSYKKAYNAVINLCAMERIAGSLPSSASPAGVLKMFESLNSSLSVKDYASSGDSAINSAAVLTTTNFKTGINFENSSGVTVSTGSDSNDQVAYSKGADTSPWITSDDGIAYVVTAPSSATCSTKAAIDATKSTADALKASCVAIVVDVNGLSKGPNRLEPQQMGETGISSLTDSVTLNTLTGDQFYIFVGRDGATAGSKKTTVTGRIVADLK